MRSDRYYLKYPERVTRVVGLAWLLRCFPKNRHDQSALGIIVTRIGLSQFIEHLINFGLGSPIRAHFRYFMFERHQHGLNDLKKVIAIHDDGPHRTHNERIREQGSAR
jgi:hypothetical protein